jgi:ribosome-associated translation inhibitor RaiA
MSVRVSGKQMEIGDSFRARIGEQIEQAVTKYFDGGYSSQVTVEKSGLDHLLSKEAVELEDGIFGCMTFPVLFRT